MNWMYEFRKEKGMSANEIANEIGVSTSYYEKIENGHRNPSYNFIKKFLYKYPDANIKQIFFTFK